MSGYDFGNFHAVTVVQCETAFHFLQVLPDTIGFGAGDVAELCSLNRETCPQIANGEADAAEAAAKLSIEIKKAKMQPCGNFHGNGDRLGTPLCKGSLPKLCDPPSFSKMNSLQCVIRSRLAIGTESAILQEVRP